MGILRNQIFAKGSLRQVFRLLCLSVVAFLLVSACSGSSNQSTVVSQPSAEGCRVIQHVVGQTCIPNHPERLVTISHFVLANALALGVKPIGTTSASDVENLLPQYLMQKVQGIELLGNQYEPRLEKIAKLKPDLILGWDNVRTIYPLLSQISPTALGTWQGSLSWRELFAFVAEALGRKEAALQAWNQYHQRVQELKLALGNQYKDKTISVLAISYSWGNYSLGKDSFAGFVLEDAGLQRPKFQGAPDSSGILDNISEELLLETIDGDFLFVLTFRDGDRKALEKLQEKPLWQKLKAVQQRHVYPVDTLTWMGSNLLAADAMIDDLYKYLVDR